jgi:hypothetical protein
MNRSFVAVAALVIALGGPASAQTFYRVAPNFQNPRVVGGEVSADGSVLLGQGFAVRLATYGEYKITFNRGLFLDACPVMTVTDVSHGENAPTPEVYQTSACSRVFLVRFFLPGDYDPVAQEFQFVAVGTQGFK